jgi:hypothetical protein
MVSDNTLIWLGEILLFSIAMTPVFVDNGYYSMPAPQERQTRTCLPLTENKSTTAAFVGLSQASVQAAF